MKYSFFYLLEIVISTLITPMCPNVLAIIYRVLTIHGTKDKMVPAEDALEFDKFIPNHKLHIIEGADHEFTSHQDELASLVIQLIKANYQKDGPTSKRADGTIDSRM